MVDLNYIANNVLQVRTGCEKIKHTLMFDSEPNTAQTGCCRISAAGIAMCLITRNAPELGVN